MIHLVNGFAKRWGTTMVFYVMLFLASLAVAAVAIWLSRSARRALEDAHKATWALGTGKQRSSRRSSSVSRSTASKRKKLARSRSANRLGKARAGSKPVGVRKVNMGGVSKPWGW
jgi:hypothetical protein